MFKRLFSTKTNYITGGNLIYSKLVENKVTDVWIYSGGAIMPVIDAFYQNDKINYFIATHEQSGGHAATGYSKSNKNNKCGVMIVTSGPGLTQFSYTNFGCSKR